MQSKIVLSFLVAVCKAAETSYEWDGPTVTSNKKTLIASGSTDWTTTGSGADRKLTQFMTQTLSFEDETQELYTNIGGEPMEERAEVYTCLPNLDGSAGFWCFVQ